MYILTSLPDPLAGSSVNPFVNNNIEGSQQKLTFEEQIGHKKPSRVYAIITVLLALTTIAAVILMGKSMDGGCTFPNF